MRHGQERVFFWTGNKNTDLSSLSHPQERMGTLVRLNTVNDYDGSF